jgi:predicted metal-dependent hydrolase
MSPDELKYTLKKSKRKTLSIYIERDGTVTVLAPMDKSDEEIHNIVVAKRYQIFKHLAQQQELNATKTIREAVNGESYPYLGRNYRLRLIDEQDVPLILKDGYFLLNKSTNAQQAFKEYYKAKANIYIPKRIDHFREQMGLHPNKVKILELQNRWASCNHNNDLNFHWKCIMAPMTIIDYIVVHELAHLRHPTHSAEFWNEVDKILPDYRERKTWLKFKGAGMDL